LSVKGIKFGNPILFPITVVDGGKAHLIRS